MTRGQEAAVERRWDARGPSGARSPGIGASAARASVAEYAFLLEHGVDQATLERACALAARWGAAPHDVLIANGWLGERDYCRALARYCGISFVEAGAARRLTPVRPERSPRQCLVSGLLRRVRGGKPGLVLTPGPERPALLRNRVQDQFARAGGIAMATPADLRAAISRSHGERLMAAATGGLARRFPGESARGGLTGGQWAAMAGLAAMTVVGGLAAPVTVLRMLTGVATLIFALVVFLRVAACINLALALALRSVRRPAARDADDRLPV